MGQAINERAFLFCSQPPERNRPHLFWTRPFFAHSRYRDGVIGLSYSSNPLLSMGFADLYLRKEKRTSTAQCTYFAMEAKGRKKAP